MSAASSHRTHTATQVLNPQRLKLLRYIWLLLVVITVVLFAIGIPANVEFFQTSALLGQSYQAVLESLGVTVTAFAVY